MKKEVLGFVNRIINVKEPCYKMMIRIIDNPTPDWKFWKVIRFTRDDTYL